MIALPIGLMPRAIAALVAVAALAAAGAGVWLWGYQVGEARADVRAANDKAAAVAAAQAQYAAQAREDDRAVLRHMEKATAAQTALDQVKKEVRDAPITLFAAVPPAQQCPTADDMRFSAGAVRLWNSALAGADIPAGACGTAGAPAGACAAVTGAGIERAHANAVENGKRFNACLSQLNSLLDQLDQRDQRAAGASATP